MTPTYTSANTLAAGCATVYMHIYVHMHAYVYAYAYASMILLDTLRRRY